MLWTTSGVAAGEPEEFFSGKIRFVMTHVSKPKIKFKIILPQPLNNRNAPYKYNRSNHDQRGRDAVGSMMGYKGKVNSNACDM